jgi:ankyrin repeat protein
LTALHAAVNYDQLACVKLLLAAPGIDVNRASTDTALYIAAMLGRLDALELLLAADRVDANQFNT